LSTNAGTFVGGGPPVGDYVTLGLGDLNLDGVTDVDDWVALRATGVTAGSGGLASLLGPQIPEPASVVLALVTAIGITIGSRRGRRL
jgi:hypothetical protein